MNKHLVFALWGKFYFLKSASKASKKEPRRDWKRPPFRSSRRVQGIYLAVYYPFLSTFASLQSLMLSFSIWGSNYVFKSESFLTFLSSSKSKSEFFYKCVYLNFNANGSTNFRVFILNSDSTERKVFRKQYISSLYKKSFWKACTTSPLGCNCVAVGWHVPC